MELHLCIHSGFFKHEHMNFIMPWTPAPFLVAMILRNSGELYVNIHMPDNEYLGRSRTSPAAA